MYQSTSDILDDIIKYSDKTYLIGAARCGWPTPHAGKFNPTAPLGAIFSESEITDWKISIRNAFLERKQHV